MEDKDLKEVPVQLNVETADTVKEAEIRSTCQSEEGECSKESPSSSSRVKITGVLKRKSQDPSAKSKCKKRVRFGGVSIIPDPIYNVTSPLDFGAALLNWSSFKDSIEHIDVTPKHDKDDNKDK